LKESLGNTVTKILKYVTTFKVWLKKDDTQFSLHHTCNCPCSL